VNLGFSIITFW